MTILRNIYSAWQQRRMIAKIKRIVARLDGRVVDDGKGNITLDLKDSEALDEFLKAMSSVKVHGK